MTDIQDKFNECINQFTNSKMIILGQNNNIQFYANGRVYSIDQFGNIMNELQKPFIDKYYKDHLALHIKNLKKKHDIFFNRLNELKLNWRNDKIDNKKYYYYQAHDLIYSLDVFLSEWTVHEIDPTYQKFSNAYLIKTDKVTQRDLVFNSGSVGFTALYEYGIKDTDLIEFNYEFAGYTNHYYCKKSNSIYGKTIDGHTYVLPDCYCEEIINNLDKYVK